MGTSQIVYLYTILWYFVVYIVRVVHSKVHFKYLDDALNQKTEV